MRCVLLIYPTDLGIPHFLLGSLHSFFGPVGVLVALLGLFDFCPLGFELMASLVVFGLGFDSICIRLFAICNELLVECVVLRE